MSMKRATLLFIFLSILGIIVFFVPIVEGVIPLTWTIDMIKNGFNEYSALIVLLFTGELVITSVLGRVFKIPCFLQKHEKDHPIETFMYITSFIGVLLIYLKAELGFIMHPNIGGQVIPLAYSILITIFVSGVAVILIVKSGLIEFVSYLIEPLMRRLFKIPGHAAIDCLSSFVTSASVGIYLTDIFYKEKKYTVREARIVATCFSVMSIGFMAVLTTMANIEHLYSEVVISSFVIMCILAFICARIPPLSNKPDIYFDGEYKQKIEEKKLNRSERIKKAFTAGIAKADEFRGKEFISFFCNSLMFSQKVIAIMITPMIIVMSIVTYTDIFDYIGRIIAPFLELLLLPDAQKIASATIIGITEVTLPVITIASLEIDIKSRFFVVVLSIVQVIYFAESANAMLSSSIPFKVKELIIMFFIRTIFAIPIVAFVTHILI